MPPRITQEGSKVFSLDYQDVYFDQQEGWDESQYVFIHGNSIAEKLRANTSLVIGELGFGTGLNLLTLLSHLPVGKRIHFQTLEINPLSLEQISQFWEHWPLEEELKKEFLEAYNPQVGENHRDFSWGKWSLYVGDVEKVLESPWAPVDCWFLDGFSPSKNPKMWSPQVLQKVFQHTKPQGSLATFTAAGWVRANLEKAGFQIERKKGFGKKKHMVFGSKPF